MRSFEQGWLGRLDRKVFLSFDFEIGWGDITNPRWRIREKAGVYGRLRSVLPELLEHLDATDIPVTWATVGGMITSSKELDFAHLPVKLRDVCSQAMKEAEADSFDGRDLFELVLASSVDHPLACHSQTHVPWHSDGIDANFIEQELLQFSAALRRYEKTSSRLVFPENREGYYSELAVAGYQVARVGPIPSAKSRAGYLLQQVVGLPPKVELSMHDSGVVRHAGSMLYNTGPGRMYRLPIVQTRAMRAVKAVQAGQLDSLHLWAHPFNFAESPGLLGGFKMLLSQLARARDAGYLTISSM